MSRTLLVKRLAFQVQYSFASMIEFVQCQIRYGIRYNVSKVDIALFWLYFFQSPYSVNRQYRIKHRLGVSYLFGETPLTALQKVCSKAQVEAGSVIFDVGCGWGRSTFFLHYYCEAHRTIGVDIHPEYIKKSERIRAWLKDEYLVFLESDFRNIEYSDADFIYLYGSCLPEDVVQELVDRWESSLCTGTKIVSTSFDLQRYSPRGVIRLTHTETIYYVWGQCEVFFHVVDQRNVD